MPKQRITKEMVVDAAFALARQDGMEQVLVKNIAQRLGCSVQPIYSYCHNMEGLRHDVEEKVRNFLREYLAAHIDKNDLFRSTGQAYIQLAKEEPNLFKIFILQKRNNVSSLEDLYSLEANPKTPAFIADKLHISTERAKQLHLNMLIYTIGVGTIFSVSSPGISIDEVYAQQEQAYRVFLNAALGEK
ncbi:MAG: TetR/AcrR family transcriptional regulator [Oscillospiraceae bacterium]|nr:TetR/AcrR family transcriptional regulator [Oscillospiraceae bacterium]